MKHIKILEQFITEAKKFKAGDKWSKDFDYEGMLAAGLKVDVNTPVKKLNKLYDSFTDVNYHTIAKGLGIAIDWIEDNDKKGAEDYMDQFHKAVQDELKVNEGINLKASHLSSEDYQKAKKLKAFDSTDWVWNPKSNLYDKVSESVTEASRGKVHKAVKKGSYPVTLVVISNGMVVKQKLVDTPEAVPAHFNTLQKEYPNANISVEDNTGKRLFSESVNEGAPRADKALKDLEKQGSEIDYLDDANAATKKIWKNAGVNPDDENTIILYSYVNDSWPETKKILKKHSVDFKELEDPNSAGESFIVFVNESIDLNEAKKFKPGDMWSNDFDYDGMMKYALTVNHKTPIKTLTKLHDSATDVNYHTPFRGLGNAIDWITDDGVNSQEGKDFMKQFHNDIKAEIKTMR